MLRHLNPKPVTLVAILMACTALPSCGGKSPSSSQAALPNIAGAWEFIATSSTGSVTGIEVALTEGKVLIGGVQQPDGQVTAGNTQIAFVTLDPASSNATSFGGNCQPITSANSLAGSVTAYNAPINFSFTENGSVFTVTGTLSGDGKSLLNGTYTAQAGNACSDPGGTISGLSVAKLSGTYVGQMCPPASSSCEGPDDFTDAVTATVSESSSSVMTMNLVLTGTDNANFTLNGPVTGNSFSLQGTFQGQTVTYYGYSELIFDSTLQTNVPSIYFVNATNTAQPAYVGTLAVPQT